MIRSALGFQTITNRNLIFFKMRRIAIIHDWLASYFGSERVLEQILHLYPKADLFSVTDFLPAGERGFLGNRRVTTSFIQRLPFARRHFRNSRKPSCLWR